MAFMIKHNDTQQVRSACSTCSLRELCLPGSLNLREIRIVDKLIKRHHDVPRGDYLFRRNSPMKSLFAIHTGFMKTSVLNAEGREQIAGFHMPCDLMGLDAISARQYYFDAVALDDCEVCEIPLEALEMLSRKIAALQMHVHRILSREIVRSHGMMLLLGSLLAEQRLVVFLLNLSQRFAARGHSPTEFVLHMTRAEIGSFLGLKLETVSRMLSRMKADKLIEVNNRRVRITDMKQLKSIANRCTATTTGSGGG